MFSDFEFTLLSVACVTLAYRLAEDGILLHLVKEKDVQGVFERTGKLFLKERKDEDGFYIRTGTHKTTE
jgi:hypothetical protein